MSSGVDVATSDAQPLLEAWLQALESGDYKQGKSYLHRIDADEGEMFCCLGVLCDVYQRTVGGLTVERLNDSHMKYDTWCSVLPEKVMKAVGLANQSGHYNKSERSLVHDNDSGQYSFADIAAIIRSRPFGLFADVEH